MNDSEIVIYNSDDGATEIDVKLKNNTLWLTQKQMGELFEKDVRTISEHINKIYKDGELEKSSSETSSGKTGKSSRPAVLYNLDMIISVGYRVNSKRGVQFRKWATNVLNKYLIEGYAVNEKRLEQLGTLVKILKRGKNQLDSGQVLDVIENYHKALTLLDDYDHKTLKKPKGNKSTYVITYDECKDLIQSMCFNETSELFGKEKDDSFKGAIGNIYQSFDGKELYPSLQEKATNLLYFLVKDHCFLDGNKRIAATLFLYFLDKNQSLYINNQKIIDDAALVALTIMIAESNPKEKKIMISVIMNCLI